MAFPVVAVAAAVAEIRVAGEAAVGSGSVVGEDHTHLGRMGVEGLEREDFESASRAGSSLGKMDTRQTQNCGMGDTTRRES